MTTKLHGFKITIHLLEGGKRWISRFDEPLCGGAQPFGLGRTPLESLANLVHAWGVVQHGNHGGVMDADEFLNQVLDGRIVPVAVKKTEKESSEPPKGKKSSERKSPDLIRMDLESLCHRKPVRVAGGETWYFECTECDQPCDAAVKE